MRTLRVLVKKDWSCECSSRVDAEVQFVIAVGLELNQITRVGRWAKENECHTAKTESRGSDLKESWRSSIWIKHLLQSAPFFFF